MKIRHALLTLPLLLAMGCGDGPSGVEKAQGEKRISINAADRFQGDLNKIFPPEIVRAIRSRPAEPPEETALSKTSALISFDEARVIILWWDLQQIIENPLYFLDSAEMCEKERARARAFEGKNPLKFDDLVSGFSQYPYMSVAHSGTLEKSGNYVEGTVTVKPGINNALVCFIKSGEIIYASSGLYLYISGLYGGSYISDYVDGWYLSPYDSSAFESWQIYRYGDDNLWYDMVNPADTSKYNFYYVTYPVIPFMNGESDMRIGIPEAWVRENSIYCR
jgi:hypothetical protein